MVKEKLNPKETVLLVMDMQIDFCSGQGILAKNFGKDPTPIKEMVPRLKDFIDFSHHEGIPVIFSQQNESFAGAHSSLKRLFGNGKLTPKCIPNFPGFGFYMLNPEKKDLVLEKRSWDLFTNPRFEKFLKKNKIKNIIITGVFTHICVESTSRRAFSEGYNVFIPRDLVSTSKQDLAHHELSLKFLESFVGSTEKAESLKEKFVYAHKTYKNRVNN